MVFGIYGLYKTLPRNFDSKMVLTALLLPKPGKEVHS